MFLIFGDIFAISYINFFQSFICFLNVLAFSESDNNFRHTSDNKKSMEQPHHLLMHSVIDRQAPFIAFFEMLDRSRRYPHRDNKFFKIHGIHLGNLDVSPTGMETICFILTSNSEPETKKSKARVAGKKLQWRYCVIGFLDFVDKDHRLILNQFFICESGNPKKELGSAGGGIQRLPCSLLSSKLSFKQSRLFSLRNPLIEVVFPTCLAPSTSKTRVLLSNQSSIFSVIFLLNIFCRWPYLKLENAFFQLFDYLNRILKMR